MPIHLRASRYDFSTAISHQVSQRVTENNIHRARNIRFLFAFQFRTLLLTITSTPDCWFRFSSCSSRNDAYPRQHSSLSTLFARTIVSTKDAAYFRTNFFTERCDQSQRIYYSAHPPETHQTCNLPQSRR